MHAMNDKLWIQIITKRQLKSIDKMYAPAKRYFEPRTEIWYFVRSSTLYDDLISDLSLRYTIVVLFHITRVVIIHVYVAGLSRANFWAAVAALFATMGVGRQCYGRWRALVSQMSCYLATKRCNYLCCSWWYLQVHRAFCSYSRVVLL